MSDKPVQAAMRVKQSLFFSCPHCGKEDAFEVTHFLPDGKDRDFGPWSCETCGWRVHGYWHHATSSVTIARILEPNSIPGFVLLSVEPTVPGKKVYIVLRHSAYAAQLDPDDPDDLSNRLTYLFEEHSCPTNFVKVDCIACDGDLDPHGVLRFEAFTPAPEDWSEEDEDFDRWARLFPQLSKDGPEIDGEALSPQMPLLLAKE